MFSASAARAVCRAAVPSRGLFSSVTAVPADPILGLVAAFKTDTAVSNTKTSNVINVAILSTYFYVYARCVPQL